MKSGGKACLIVCTTVILPICIVVCAVVVYLYFSFAAPQITFLSLQAPTNATYVGRFSKSFQQEWSAITQISNMNSYGVLITSMKLTGTLDGVAPEVPLFSSNLSDVSISGHGEVANVTIPLSLNWTLAADPQRIVLLQLYDSCSPRGEPLVINFYVETILKAASLGPFYLSPVFQTTIQPCPLLITNSTWSYLKNRRVALNTTSEMQ